MKIFYNIKLKELITRTVKKVRSSFPPSLPPSLPEQTNSNDVDKGYKISGNNNIIIIIEEDGYEHVLSNDEKIPGLEISIEGNNNTIRIISPCYFEGATFILKTSESSITINKSPKFMWYVKLVGGDHETFYWGENSYTNGIGECHILDSGGSVRVGNDCMFADQVSIFGSDGHTIYDNLTQEVLNNIKNGVGIGNHCWICRWAHFTKNANIGNDVVVAQNAVVTKSFSENNIIIGGNPAKIIKRNCNWDKLSTIAFQKKSKKI